MTRAAALLMVVVTAGCAQTPPTPPNPRAAEIAPMLAKQPTGLGKPISDRACWDLLAASEAGADVVKNAANLLRTPLPEQPDDLFLEFSRNGNRTRWQNVAARRRGRIDTFTVAECLENKGRFIRPLEEAIAALCAERTWLMPAHDGKLDNFNGKVVDIDLASSALGWRLGTSAWLLGDKLSAATRALIADNVAKRVTTPFRDMIEGRRGRNWWMTTTNNWNAVCLAGSTGAALVTIDKAEDRAVFVAGAEQYIQNFLKGFTPDGYCSEGMGYWNYGFGNFVDLAETLNQATGGKLDLLANPAAKAPASFGPGLEITSGVYPAFADCGVGAQPSAVIMAYLNKRFDLGLAQYAQMPARSAMGDLVTTLLYALPNSLSAKPATTVAAAVRPVRTYFKDAGILIDRPGDGGCRLGVALKGGNNNEHHNHNDVGSYVVVVGGSPVLLDPGAEAYTARTFSSRRYESKLLNSFGHAVPRVAGKLQAEGAESRGKVLAAEFGDQADTYRLDLASCYRVPELTRLERNWVFSRAAEGSLVVTDTVAFTSPQSFGTAMITAGSWKQIAPDTFLAGYAGEVVQVKIAVEGGEFATDIVQIKEESSVQPYRLGIEMTKPVTNAAITMTITPARLPGETGGSLLRDGSFETAEWFWTLGAADLAKVEALPEGGQALHITDAAADRGTDINSTRMDAAGDRSYVFTGRVKHVKGAGIGVYVNCYDDSGNRLNPIDGNGNMAPIGTLSGAEGKWVDIAIPFKTPAGTTRMALWIHSFNGAQVDAYLDKLAIMPVR